MTTKTKIIIGASVVALVGGYFIYKKLRGNKPFKTPVIDDTKSTTTTDDTKQTTTTTDDNICLKYMVNVSKGNLNIRKEPNVKSKIIGSIPKGKEKYAKKSNTEGWMELCEDGGGFVSSQYLKEVN
jgi:uncharacterized protein YgiM (DUF1202 family)